MSLIGFLLGQLPFYLPGVGKLTLGTTGGVLAAGLLLSSLYKLGPVVWEIPVSANNFIRDLGLALFLATVGTSAGATIVATIEESGLALVGAGALVSLLPMVASVALCRLALGIPFLRMLGMLAGGMTSTPGLAATSSMSQTFYAGSAYATVYPVALIGMILWSSCWSTCSRSPDSAGDAEGWTRRGRRSRAPGYGEHR